MKLIEYNAALHALDRATRLDEVKKIRDWSVAARTYAEQAKDSSAVKKAVCLKVTAETRAGGMLLEMSVQGKRASRGDAKKSRRATIKLEDLKITKQQASKWQKLFATQQGNPKKWATDLERVTRLAVAATEGDKAVITEARAERQRDKIKSRKQRIETLTAKNRALPDKKYNVILADPEWDFKVWSEKGKDRSAENHYTVSSMPVIRSRPVEKIAADDAVLFLWATVPMLPQALEVMMSWGFFYVSHFIWYKNKIGTGYWNCNKHELLLIGRRGDIPAPAMGSQFEFVIEAKVGLHSQKPKKFHEIIEEYFPNLPKIELNCVGKPRPGWDGWGHEVEVEQEHEDA